MTASTTDSSATRPSGRRYWIGTLWKDHHWDGSACMRRHLKIATRAEIYIYRGNWSIHSNMVNFDTIPTRHQPDFKKALSTMYRLKKAEDDKQYAEWSQNSSSLAMASRLVGVRLWELTPKMGWPLIERGNLCIQWPTIHLRYESQQELNSIFIVNFSVTADGSLPSPTEGVNTIHPEPEIHEQIFMTKGYGTMCTTTSTFSPTLEPMWPTTWTTRRTQTSWPCSIEHTARRL